MNRRDLFRLATPLLFLRCTTETPQVILDARLHSRPEPPAHDGPPTKEPRRLGLSSQRDGFYYVPRNASGSLLVFLHGATGSGERAISHVLDEADRTGTIVIAPDSRLRTWGFDADDEPQDVGFIDDALEKVFAGYRVDPQRIAIAGFSDGASAALSWGLINGDFFSAIAAFSPGFVHLSSLATGRPRIFISHGAQDSILPVDKCGRRIARELRDDGYAVRYREFQGDHEIPAEVVQEGVDWAVGHAIE